MANEIQKKNQMNSPERKTAANEPNDSQNQAQMINSTGQQMAKIVQYRRPKD